MTANDRSTSEAFRRWIDFAKALGSAKAMAPNSEAAMQASFVQGIGQSLALANAEAEHYAARPSTLERKVNLLELVEDAGYFDSAAELAAQLAPAVAEPLKASFSRHRQTILAEVQTLAEKSFSR
jgi:hypothetical protein